MNIKGKVSYQTLGPGFYGIIGDDKKKYKPINMPEELKIDGIEVEIEAEEAKAQMSIFMWGTNIKILKYQVI